MKSFSRFLLIALLLLSFLPEPLEGQVSQKKTRIMMAGLNGGLMGANFKGPYPNYQAYRMFGYQVEPFVGVFLRQNWVVGATGSYGQINSNFIQLAPFYDLGYWARFYWPLKDGQLDFYYPQTGFRFRFLPYFELGHRFSNTYTHRTLQSQVVHNRPDIQRLIPTVGIDFKLKGNLYLEVAYRHQLYLNAPAQHSWLNASLGVNYIFDPEEKNRDLKRPLGGKKSRYLKFVYRPKRDSLPRFRPFNRLILGTNLTYIWDVARFGGVEMQGSVFKELTWHLNAAVPLTRKLNLGFDYLQQFTHDPFSGGNRSWMAGPFLQYNLIPLAWKLHNPGKKFDRFYLELGGYKGNYCTCDPDNPFQKEDLYYIGMGMGVDIALKKWLHLDIGFTNYEILTEVLGKYNYTQYTLGVDFHLFNWNREN